MSVSIIDFGADPTGNADSTQAIFNALNSGSSHIIAPEGVYKIRSINFSAWGIPDHSSKPYIFDASAAKFVHDSTSNDFAMVSLYPGETNQLIRCIFKFGFLEGGSNLQNILYIRHCNNSKIEVAYVGPSSNSTGIFCNQENNPSFGAFNNFIEIQDIADCQNGFTIYADIDGTNVNGFEGNTIKIGRLGFCTTNGLTIGRFNNVRVIFNTFILGPIEHNSNGYGIYERGGGNQFYVNNLNANGNGIGAVTGLSRKSLFVVSNQNSVDSVITQQHFYTNVYLKTTNW